MTDQTKIPAPEPKAWTLHSELHFPQTTYTHKANLWFLDPQNPSWAPIYTADQLETYAAALAEKARQDERERLHTLAQQMMDEATEGNWAQAAVIMEQMLRAG